MRPAIIWAVVPAAGAATRFGGGKLTVEVAGRPLLDHTLRALLDAGLDGVVLVAPPGDAFAVVDVAADARVRTVVNPDPSRGMFSSIQRGLAAVPDDAQWVAVLPADMPFVRARTIATVIGAARAGCNRPAAGAGHGEATAIVPTHDGRRGHPIVLSAGVGRALVRQPASTSLKAALISLDVPFQEIVVDDAGVLRDVDVKEDLAPRSP